MTTAWTKKLSIQVCAAAAAGCLGIGVINQVIAQDDDTPAPAAEQPADAPQNDAADNDAADNDAPPDNVSPDNDLQNDASKDVDAPDAPTDDTPPALPDDGRDNDDVRDDRRNRNFDDDDRISPSDRRLDGRVERVEQQNNRSDVRRFDYDDPSQPIPEGQSSGYQGHGHARWGHGCHPCGHRVYHNPCGGCGSSFGNGSNNGSYQTQSHQPNRPVIGITIDDEADGVRVVSVVPNSPAEQAGVQSGDRIVAIGGREIDDCAAVMSHIRGLSSGRQVSLTVDRDGEQHQLDAQASMYAQVFGNNRGGNVAGVPAAPRDRFAQNGQTRTVFRPDFDEADDNERLDRVQMRIGQLELELKALRQEEQDLQNTAAENEEPKSVDDADAPDITPPAELPTPADDRDASSTDDADVRDDSDAIEPQNDLDTDVDIETDTDTDTDTDADESSPPDNRDRLSPSAR